MKTTKTTTKTYYILKTKKYNNGNGIFENGISIGKTKTENLEIYTLHANDKIIINEKEWNRIKTTKEVSVEDTYINLKHFNVYKTTEKITTITTINKKQEKININ